MESDNILCADRKGGNSEPNQAGYQEGQAAVCPKLLPSQRLSLELRRFPTGPITMIFSALLSSLTYVM